MIDLELGSRLAIIVASNREKRFADTVVNWFVAEIEGLHDGDVDVIDLRDVELPVSLMSSSAGLKAFSKRIDSADMFVIITPEYNHGYPAALKHALDSVRSEWAAKPVGFVSYGGMSGGIRAVEQLKLVVAELHMVSIRDGVSIHNAWNQFDRAGQPIDSKSLSVAIKTLMRQLKWWSNALSQMRETVPYSA